MGKSKEVGILVKKQNIVKTYNEKNIKQKWIMLITKR
jgi:hypothetical protein